MKCATRNSTAASSVASSIGSASIVPVRSSTFAWLLEARLRGRKHRARFVDGDDATDARRERFGDMAGAAAEVADDPRFVEEIEQREQVGARADHLGAHRVPRVGRVQEEDLRLVAALGEHAVRAARILRRDRRAGELIAHDGPQVARGWLELAEHHLVESARSFAAGDEPAVVGQQLEMAADRGLRQLQDGAQLADRKLIPVKQ